MTWLPGLIPESTLDVLRDRLTEFNESVPSKHRLTMAHVRAVYRSAARDYDPHHRPGLSRQDWALARWDALAAQNVPAPSQPLVASRHGGIIIDSLGRRWDPRKHPRDRYGKFIETGGFVRLFARSGDSKGYAVGEVSGINPDGSVAVLVTGARDPKLVGTEQRVRPTNIAQATRKATLNPNALKPGQTAPVSDTQRDSRARLPESPPRPDDTPDTEESEPSWSDDDSSRWAESRARGANEITVSRDQDNPDPEISDPSVDQPVCASGLSASLWLPYPQVILAAATADACSPRPPTKGRLGSDLAWENRDGRLVISGKTFMVKDRIKAAGRFRWDKDAKNWYLEGSDEARAEVLARLQADFGDADQPAADIVDPIPDVAESYPPTDEQQAIIDAVNDVAEKNAGVVVARALAGTGKTSTMQMIARLFKKERPEQQIAYVAFNKSIQKEAARKMPGNVEARTGDSLSYVAAPKALQKRVRNGLRRLDEVAAQLGIRDVRDEEGNVLDPDQAADRVVKAVSRFAISADDEIGLAHLGGDSPTSRALLPYAQAAWADLQDKNGKLYLDNSHLTKMWALTRPDLSTTGGSGLKKAATIIFMDEAQDTNPVLARVMAEQRIPVVYVGDTNQAIYGFRGAVDQLEKIQTDYDLPLTKSWRFGPQVAAMGNRFLQLLRSPHRIEGGGPSGVVYQPGEMVNPDAVLVRTNGGMIGEIAEAQRLGRTVGVTAGTKPDLYKLVETAQWLQGGPRPRGQLHDDLAPYRNWAEVQAAAEKGDDPKVRMLARIVDQVGVSGLRQMVNKLIDTGVEGHQIPDVLISTAHKCVAPSTLVETPNGLMPISDIPNSGVIGTASGPRSYQEKFTRPNSPVLNIVTRRGYQISATPDHGMIAYRNGQHRRVDAGDLKAGDFLRLRLGSDCDAQSYPTLPAPEPLNSRAESWQIPEHMSEELAELLGLLVADGTIFSTGKGLRVVKRYISVIDRMAVLVKDLFGYELVRRTDGVTPCGEIYSVQICRWLQDFGGLDPHRKNVPTAVLRSPLSVHAAFLRGLFEDGTVNLRGDLVDHIHWDTAIPEMAATVQTMLLRLGISSTRKSHHGRTTLYLYSEHARRFADTVGFMAEEKNARCTRFRPDTRNRVPVTREELDTLDLDKFTRANARARGFLTRHIAVRVAEEQHSEFLQDRLKWLYEQVYSITPGESTTMCVEVPEGGQFLQNGFDGSNSKGLEWNKVKIGEDFFGPQQDKETGEVIMPAPEEMRLAYVAVTRAMQELDPGSLAWIYDYTNENGDGDLPDVDISPESAEPIAELPDPTAAPEVDLPEQRTPIPTPTPEAPEAAEPTPNPQSRVADYEMRLEQAPEDVDRIEQEIETDDNLSDEDKYDLAGQIIQIRDGAIPTPMPDPVASDPSAQPVDPNNPEAGANRPRIPSIHGRQRQIPARPADRLGPDRNGDNVFAGARVRVLPKGGNNPRPEMEAIVIRHNPRPNQKNKADFVVRIPDENATRGYRDLNVVPGKIELIDNNGADNLEALGRRVAGFQGRRLGQNRMREDLLPQQERRQVDADGTELLMGDRVAYVGSDPRYKGREGDVAWLQDQNRGNYVRVRFDGMGGEGIGGQMRPLLANNFRKIGGIREEDRRLFNRPATAPGQRIEPSAEELDELLSGDNDRLDTPAQEALRRVRAQLPDPRPGFNNLQPWQQDMVRAAIAVDNALALPEDAPGYDENMRTAEELLARALQVQLADQINAIRQQVAGASQMLPAANRRERVPITQARGQWPPQAAPRPDDQVEARQSRPLPEPAENREPAGAPAPAPARPELSGATPYFDDLIAQPLPTDPDKAYAALEELVWAINGERTMRLGDPDVTSAGIKDQKSRKEFAADLTDALELFSAGRIDRSKSRLFRAIIQLDDPEYLANADLRKYVAGLRNVLFSDSPSALIRREDVPDLNPDLVGMEIRQNAANALMIMIAKAREGGFTFDARAAGWPDRGYAVAMSGFEQIFPGQQGVTPEQLDAYIDQHLPALRQNDRLHVGGWYDKDTDAFYLDLPEVIEDRDEAIQTGLRRGERAIFDLANLEEIDLRGLARDGADTPEPGAGPAEDGSEPPGAGGDGRGVQGPDARAVPRGGPPPRELIARFQALIQAVGSQRDVYPKGSAGQQRIEEAFDALQRAWKSGGPRSGDQWDDSIGEAIIAMRDGGPREQRQADGLARLARDFQDWYDTSTDEPTPTPTPTPTPGPEPEPDTPGPPPRPVPLTPEPGALERVNRNLDLILDRLPLRDDQDYLQRVADMRRPGTAEERLDRLDALIGQTPETWTQRDELIQQRALLQEQVERGAGQGGLFTPPARDPALNWRYDADADMRALGQELGPDTRDKIETAIRATSDDVRSDYLGLAQLLLVNQGLYDAARRVEAARDPNYRLPPADDEYLQLRQDLEDAIDGIDMASVDPKTSTDRMVARAVGQMIIYGDPAHPEFATYLQDALKLATDNEDLQRKVDNALRRFNGEELRRAPAIQDVAGKAAFVPNITPIEWAERTEALADELDSASEPLSDAIQHLRKAAEAGTVDGQMFLEMAEWHLRRNGDLEKLRQLQALKAQVDGIPTPDNLSEDQISALNEVWDFARELRQTALDPSLDPAVRNTAASLAGAAEDLAVLQDQRLPGYQTALADFRNTDLSNSPDLLSKQDDLLRRLPGGQRTSAPKQSQFTVVADAVTGATIDWNGIRWPNGDPGGLNTDELSSGAIGTSYVITDVTTGQKFILKKDPEDGGAEAENDAALFYRELGFEMPEVRLVGNRTILMDFAGAAQGYKSVGDAADMLGVQVLDFPALSDLNLSDERDILRFVAANGVIGNSDRHGLNAMFAWDDAGNGHILPIDHGRTLGNYDSEGSDVEDPRRFLWTYFEGGVGNANFFGRAAAEYVMNDRDQARETLVDWAERMREVAEQKRNDFADDENYDRMITRIEYIAQHPDAYLDAVEETVSKKGRLEVGGWFF